MLPILYRLVILEPIRQFFDQLGLCELDALSIAILVTLAQQLNDFVLRLLEDLRELSLQALHESCLVELGIISPMIVRLRTNAGAYVAVVVVVLMVDSGVRGFLHDELR